MSESIILVGNENLNIKNFKFFLSSKNVEPILTFNIDVFLYIGNLNFELIQF